jgi:hypothetical protein
MGLHTLDVKLVLNTPPCLNENDNMEEISTLHIKRTQTFEVHSHITNTMQIIYDFESY